MNHRTAPTLAPYRYIGDTVPHRAAGLSLPLLTGTVVYLERKPGRRALVTINTRPDGRGSAYYLRAVDLRAEAEA